MQPNTDMTLANMPSMIRKIEDNISRLNRLMNSEPEKSRISGEYGSSGQKNIQEEPDPITAAREHIKRKENADNRVETEALTELTIDYASTGLHIEMRAQSESGTNIIRFLLIREGIHESDMYYPLTYHAKHFILCLYDSIEKYNHFPCWEKITQNQDKDDFFRSFLSVGEEGNLQYEGKESFHFHVDAPEYKPGEQKPPHLYWILLDTDSFSTE